MNYKEIKSGCDNWGQGIAIMENGVEVCGLSHDKRCWAHSCPIYHMPKVKVSYHKNRALDKTGLREQFTEEMT